MQQRQELIHGFYQYNTYPPECRAAVVTIQQVSLMLFDGTNGGGYNDTTHLEAQVLSEYMKAKLSDTTVHLFMTDPFHGINLSTANVLPGQVFVFVPEGLKSRIKCARCESLATTEGVYWVVPFDKLAYNPHIQFNNPTRLCMPCIQERYQVHPDPDHRLDTVFDIRNSPTPFASAHAEWMFPFRTFRTSTGLIQHAKTINAVRFGWNINEYEVLGVYIPRKHPIKKADATINYRF